jgi:hypothetical protein
MFFKKRIDKMKTYRTPICILIDPELLIAIEKMAHEEHTTKSALIRKILSAAVQNYSDRTQK